MRGKGDPPGLIVGGLEGLVDYFGSLFGFRMQHIVHDGGG
jgi:hypothetical protein